MPRIQLPLRCVLVLGACAAPLITLNGASASPTALVGGLTIVAKPAAAAQQAVRLTPPTTTTTPGTGATTTTTGSGSTTTTMTTVVSGAPGTTIANGVMPDKPVFPMQVTPVCYILDNFGAPRSGGRTHEGTDMLAYVPKAGEIPSQEVYAVIDGKVGNQVIDGQSGSSLSGNSWRVYSNVTKTYYMYAHLSRFAAGLINGSPVVQGQVIGYVGDTGDPGVGNFHLHFEVHPNGGSAVNALTVLNVPTGCTVQRSAS